MPSVRDLWSYGETGFHSLAAAVVRDRYAREAMVSAFRILGEGQLSLTKFLILTDAPRDLRDFPGLLEHVLARAEWWRDLFVFSNLSQDTLDYTGPKVNHGIKGRPARAGARGPRAPARVAGRTAARRARRARLLSGLPGRGGRANMRTSRVSPSGSSPHPAFAEWPLVVLSDDVQIAESASQFLWGVFTRFEPAGDIYSAGADVRRHHLAYRPPILVDARMKPAYPRELFPETSIVERVDRRWREYFPAGMEAVERPSGEPVPAQPPVPSPR